MRQRNGRGFSSAEIVELWDRWQRGESQKEIGRAFGKPSSSIHFQLAPYGGIRPAPRRRSRLALTLSEREEISRGIVARRSIRSLARSLGRSPSTVSREVRRNGGYARYRAAAAEQRAWDEARRPKRCKLARNRRLARAVAAKLRDRWSPEQIAGWLKRTHRGDESNQVSHETIYRSLYVQARGALKKELDPAASYPAHDASFQERYKERRRPGANQGHDHDQRAAGLGRGSGGARTLGG